MQREIIENILPVLGLEHFGKGTVEEWMLESQMIARECYSIDQVTLSITDTIYLPDSYGIRSIITIKNH